MQTRDHDHLYYIEQRKTFTSKVISFPNISSISLNLKKKCLVKNPVGFGGSKKSIWGQQWSKSYTVRTLFCKIDILRREAYTCLALCTVYVVVVSCTVQYLKYFLLSNASLKIQLGIIVLLSEMPGISCLAFIMNKCKLCRHTEIPLPQL